MNDYQRGDPIKLTSHLEAIARFADFPSTLTEVDLFRGNQFYSHPAHLSIEVLVKQAFRSTNL